MFESGHSNERDQAVEPVIRKVKAVMSRISKAEGELGESAKYHLDSGGHFLRASLIARTCCSLGIGESSTVSMGAALEFLHNASLIHDDVQDSDEVRRSQPSVWKKYGVNTAVSLGDFFITLAYLAAMEIDTPHEIKVSLLQLMAQRTLEVIRGQAREMDSRSLSRLAIDDYEEIARAKTGPLIALTMEGPLLLSGASYAILNAAKSALTWFGLAYQIRDDIQDYLSHKSIGNGDAERWSCSLNCVALCYSADVDSASKLKPSGMDLLDSAPNAKQELIESLRQRVAIDTACIRFRNACDHSRAEAAALPTALRQIIEETVDAISISLIPRGGVTLPRAASEAEREIADAARVTS